MDTGIIVGIGILILLLGFPSIVINLDNKRKIFSTIMYFFVFILVAVAAIVSGPINCNIDDVLAYHKAVVSQQLTNSIESESLEDIIEKANNSIDFKGLNFNYDIVDITDTVKELSIELKGSKFGIFKVSYYEQYIVDIKNHTIELK